MLVAAPPAAESARRRRKPKDKPARVRTIDVETRNVFDTHQPGEDLWIFRAANWIHRRTRDQAIRDLLLMRPGEMTRRQQVEESERLLRAQAFIQSADIEIIPAPDNQVDLRVRTQDTWTLQPQVNYGQEGGETKFSAGVLEENFLGFGKTVSYFYKEDNEGVAHEMAYKDPLLFGTRLQLDTQGEWFPTGNAEQVRLARPFFALSTRWSAGLDGNHETRLQKILENGQEINRYQRKALNGRAFGGVRIGGDVHAAHRLNLQWGYTEERFEAHAESDRAAMPEDRVLTGPFANWTFEESDFIKETFIDKAGRTEDFNLGHRWDVGGGYYDESIGASESAAPFKATDAFGFTLSHQAFGTSSWGATGRYSLEEAGWTRKRMVNTLYFANLNLYRHWTRRFPAVGVMHAEGAYVQNADAQNQLELGGDTGLRGYKNQAYSGNKSALLNLETRAWIPSEIFHLFYLGAAAFVDAGQAQPQGQDFALKDTRANIGGGLRIGLSRAAGGSVIRIDLAYALIKQPGEDRIVLSITTGPGFKSSGNTFSKYPGTPAL